MTFYSQIPAFKIGLTQSELCSFCNTCPETIDHLFFYCVYSRAFWEESESYWIAIAKEVVQQMVSCISGNGKIRCFTENKMLHVMDEKVA